MLRLQQLVHAASTESLILTTPLDVTSAETFPAAARLAASQANGQPLSVRSARERVHESEQRLAAARSQRFPTVTAFSTYEGVSYAGRRLPTAQDFRANWTVGGRIDMPLFAGRGIADEAEARARLSAAQAEQRDVERRTAFDLRAAVTQLAVAEAAFAVSAASVHEALQAYNIALLRHTEGMSIQLELDDARIALEESRAEQARATRDVLVERVRAALLPALPPGRAIAR
jgi:outer membrane protein TolC